MIRFVWLPIIVGTALLVASSGLARQLPPGLLSPDIVATLTNLDPDMRWACRIVGAASLIFGLRLFFGTRARPSRAPLR